MRASASEESLGRKYRAAPLDMAPPCRGIEEQANRAQAKQGEEEDIQLRGHRLKDDYAISRLDALRVKQRCDSSGLCVQFDERKSAFSAVADVDNGRRLW